MLAENLEMIGLHTHIGTYIMVASAYGIAATKLSNLYMAIHKKFDHWLKYIDLGGGFASKNTLKGAYMPGSETCPSFDEYAEAISNAIISSEIPHENLPVLFLETGRALIDDAGYLIASVVGNKRLPNGVRSMVIDAGVDVIETLSPPPLGDIDLAEVKRLYGDKVCLKGNVDQVNTICYGTKEEVRQAVRAAIEATGGGTGHILSTSDSMRPESPIENVRAYFDAWREFRR